MLTTYSHAQMLEIWRTHAGLEPTRTDCTIEAIEGIDTNEYIEAMMRPWYLHLLDTAPTDKLPTANVAAETTLTTARSGTKAFLQLPPRGRRLLQCHLSSWTRDARPELPDDNRLDEINNPFTTPTRHYPACLEAAATVHCILPYDPARDRLDTAIAVVDPGPNTYILDPSLLTTIPDILYNHGLKNYEL